MPNAQQNAVVWALSRARCADFPSQCPPSECPVSRPRMRPSLGRFVSVAVHLLELLFDMGDAAVVLHIEAEDQALHFLERGLAGLNASEHPQNRVADHQQPPDLLRDVLEILSGYPREASPGELCLLLLRDLQRGNGDATPEPGGCGRLSRGASPAGVCYATIHSTATCMGPFPTPPPPGGMVTK